MTYDDVLTTARCAATFAEEIKAAGGTVSDSFDDGCLLIARSILPWVGYVRPRDQMSGGVALRVFVREISVHPYVFRQICRNGVIVAESVRSRHVQVIDEMTPMYAESELRQAIRACTVKEAFDESVQHIRTSLELQVDRALGVLSLLKQIPRVPPGLTEIPGPDAADVFRSILERVQLESDRSGFALMNAVTSVARDTADPELRWRLEKLGGAVPALLARDEFPPNDHAVRADEFTGYLAALGGRLRTAT